MDHLVCAALAGQLIFELVGRDAAERYAVISDDYGNLVEVPSIAALKERLDQGDERFARVEKELAENTAATQRIEASTAEMVEFFSAMKGAFKVLNWVGAAAKPIGAIVAAFTAISVAWATFRGHK